MNLIAGNPDPKTITSSATFGTSAPVRHVVDASTGERIGWIRPSKTGWIEWRAFTRQGLERTEAEALEAMTAAVLEYRACEVADAAHLAEVLSLPEPERTARRNRDKAAVAVEIERSRSVIRQHDLDSAERALSEAEAELEIAMTISNRRAAA